MSFVKRCRFLAKSSRSGGRVCKNEARVLSWQGFWNGIGMLCETACDIRGLVISDGRGAGEALEGVAASFLTQSQINFK